MKLSVSGAIRKFAYFMASGTHVTLQDIDYVSLYGEEPSAIEKAFAIFVNVLEVDDEGTVTNARYAEDRAAQYLRRYCDPSYSVEPPFEDWELELH